MDTKHTPGPWTTHGVHDKILIRAKVTGSDSTKKTIAVVEGFSVSNALLIAAAPELLEALTSLEGYLRETPHHNSTQAAAARAAIAKATGAA